MEPRCYVVVEGRLDGELLSVILGDRVTSGAVRVVEANGKSEAEASARTLLTVKRAPVLLLVDANTTDPDGLEEERLYFQEAVGGYADTSRWRLVLAEPELESILFDPKAEPVLRDLLGATLTECDQVEALYAPKKVLSRLADGEGGPLRSVVRRLRPDHIAHLRQTSLMQQVITGIAEMTGRAAA